MQRLSVLLCSLSIFIAISSCQETNPDQNTMALNGTWVDVASTETATVNTYLSYHFKANNQLEILRVIINDNNNEVLGFKYRGLGTYSLYEETLTLSVNEVYLNNDTVHGYTALENLVLTDGTFEEVVTISFSENNKILTFEYPPCQATHNCQGELTLYKSELPF
ncbi:MAG: hypothetical protein HEP71_02030 [Roseivirga sp.]|nr:hypothetical protein [Roseivirga sp.]